MGNSKDIFRLTHMLDSILKIEELKTVLHSYDNFEKQWVERDALIRNFEIIGDASIHISDELKVKYPDVAWKELKGMRNFISHEYFGLQLDSIWATTTTDLPFLKDQIKLILDELSK